MQKKKPQCPQCGENSKINSDKVCENCGQKLEYSDEEGTLRVVQDKRLCPRCNTENSKDVKFCENCGTLIGKFCGYCKKYHFIEDKVCPKTGEPIKGETENIDVVSPIPKILTALSIMTILFLGFLTYKFSYKPNPPKNSPTPIYVIVKPTQIPIIQYKKPRIDVVFTVDCTGSMGDEIEVVKNKIREIIRKTESGQPRPDVRYGLVAYRDRGDQFVTKKYELTRSLNNIISNVMELSADGGGDTPESVNEALHRAVTEMNWDNNTNTKKMIFLIGDAAPHNDYPDDYDYKSECYAAKKKGIKIFTIGCTGIESSGEGEFREIAQLTGGEFDFLTYQQTYTQDDGREMKVLTAGKRTFVLKEGVRDKDWKAGYKDIINKGKAKEIDRSTLSMPSMPASIGRTRRRGKAHLRVTSGLKNNLDEMMTRQIQKEAESMGVKYKK